MKPRRCAAVTGLVAAMLVAFPLHAGAHAVLRSSDPADGVRLPASPQELSLTFTEPPERSLSVVRVLDPIGAQYGAGPAAISPGDKYSLVQKVRSLPDGVYTVSWRVVSKVDGHVTSGAFAFGVGQTTTPIEVSNAPRESTPPVSPGEVAGRFAFFVGVAGLLGAAFIAGSLGGELTRRFRLASWLIALAGAVILLLVQGTATGSLGTFLGTSLGRIAIARVVATGVAGVGLAMKHRAAMWLSAIFTAVAVLTHVAGGHAAAAPVPASAIAGQWVHVVAGGIWIGGLAALLVAVRRTDDCATIVKRFSTVAAYLIGVVALTGVIRALGQVAFGDLFSTAYGREVLAKSSLLLVLAGFGAVNRFRSVPAAVHGPAMLLRVSRGELTVAALTFGVAALLASTSPPQKATAAQPAPAVLRASGADFGTSVRVDLEARPGGPGPNDFAVRVVDYDTRRPVDAKVSLRFTFLDDPSVGTSQLVLSRGADGTFTGKGSNLSLQGRWRIVVLVERGVDTVDVPLEVDVRVPSKVRVDRVPGQPTLYTIDLPGRGSVQIYADPERPGETELHVTFFDTKGNELPIASIQLTIDPPSGSAFKNTPRRFTPGHFAADITIEKGITHVAVTAKTNAGQTISTELDVRI